MLTMIPFPAALELVLRTFTRRADEPDRAHASLFDPRSASDSQLRDIGFIDGRPVRHRDPMRD